MIKSVSTFFCFSFCLFCSLPLCADDLIPDDFFQELGQKTSGSNVRPKISSKAQKSAQKKSGWLSKYIKFLKAEENLYKTKYPVYPESQIAHFLFGWMPEYQELRFAKAEMERRSEFGFYNYSHRLAMCRIGQMGGAGSFFSPTIGLVFSAVKELDDLYQKSFVGSMPLTTTIAQSLVDMENAYEAVQYGFDHPNENCRSWLEHLDYKTNTWQKEKIQSDFQYIVPNEKAIESLE